MTTATRTARFVTTHSILTLDARHPFVAKSLMDAQAMHRTVMSGFYGWVEDGAPDPRAQLGVLSTWSLDLKHNALVLVVQSRVAPDWSNIPSAALTSAATSLTVDMTIREGDSYTFRTVIHPTRTQASPATGNGPRSRGRRTSHTHPKHVSRWFLERNQSPGEPPVDPRGIRRIGAAVDESRLSVRMLPTLSSPAPHKGLRIVRAEIKGSLVATDPHALATALTDGIGRARAYSTGLLLIRPTS